MAKLRMAHASRLGQLKLKSKIESSDDFSSVFPLLSKSHRFVYMYPRRAINPFRCTQEEP